MVPNQLPPGHLEKEGVVCRPDGLKYLAPQRAAAFIGLLRAGQILSAQLNTEIEAKHGLSLREFEVLLFLAVFSPAGELRMAQLIEQAPLSQSRVSRLVADLAARGLVERSPAAEDGRGVMVKITPAGLKRFRAVQETHLSGLEKRLFSPLTAAEVRQLAAITAKILEASC